MLVVIVVDGVGRTEVQAEWALESEVAGAKGVDEGV